MPSSSIQFYSLMRFDQFLNGVRDWCGDPPEEHLPASEIAMHVIAALDLRAAQVYNANKGTIEISETITADEKEENLAGSYGSGRPYLVRKRLTSADATEHTYERVNIVDTRSALTEAELKGWRVVYFQGNAPMKMILSWYPNAESGEVFQIFGSDIAFGALSIDKTIVDVPALFHHLIVEEAALKGLNRLLKPSGPEDNRTIYRDFVIAQKMDLREQLEERKILWRSWLADEFDNRARDEVQCYDPLLDSAYIHENDEY